jgi:carbon monoxide dehydrogenase subunit G
VDRAWAVLLEPERVAPCVPGATLDSVDGDEVTGRLKVKLGAMTITYRGSAQLTVTDESARIVTIEVSAKEARGTGTATATVQAQLHGDGDGTRVTVHTKLNITGRPAQFGRDILAETGGKLISRFAKALAGELQISGEERAVPPAEPAALAAEAPARTASDPIEAQVPATEPQVPATEPQALAEEALPRTADVGVAEDPATEAAEGPEAGEITGAETTAEAGKTPVTPRPVRHGEEAIDLPEVAGPSVVKRAAPVFGGVLAALTIRYLFRRRRGRHHR